MSERSGRPRNEAVRVANEEHVATKQREFV
jgi:hypothetical protein